MLFESLNNLCGRYYHYPLSTDEKIEVERDGAGVQTQVCPFIELYNFSKLFHANGIIYAEGLCG